MAESNLQFGKNQDERVVFIGAKWEKCGDEELKNSSKQEVQSMDEEVSDLVEAKVVAVGNVLPSNEVDSSTKNGGTSIVDAVVTAVLPMGSSSNGPLKMAYAVDSSQQMKTNSTKNKLRKSVCFNKLEIREYPCTLGDNPCVSCGPPIQLAWTPEHEYTMQLDDYESTFAAAEQENCERRTACSAGQHSVQAQEKAIVKPLEQTTTDECVPISVDACSSSLCTDDAAEQQQQQSPQHAPRRRTLDELRLSPEDRVTLLLGRNWSAAEIEGATREVRRIQAQRAASNSLDVEGITEVWQSAVRKFQRLINRKIYEQDPAVQWIKEYKKQKQQQNNQQELVPTGEQTKMQQNTPAQSMTNSGSWSFCSDETAPMSDSEMFPVDQVAE